MQVKEEELRDSMEGRNRLKKDAEPRNIAIARKRRPAAGTNAAAPTAAGSTASPSYGSFATGGKNTPVGLRPSGTNTGHQQ